LFALQISQEVPLIESLFVSYKLLIINPGGTSTKLAVFQDDRPLFSEVIRHSPEELGRFPGVVDQEEFRLGIIMSFLEKKGLRLADLSAVVGRGGTLKPLRSGTYRVVPAMIEDIRGGRVFVDHASNLGALLAFRLSEQAGTAAFIVNPVSVDEFIPEARLSGLPELERTSMSHALNLKIVCRMAADSLQKRYQDINLVAVHLGSGITVSAHRRGRMIDVNNAVDGGPFAPTRTGSLPTTGLIKLCFSGRLTEKQLLDLATKKGGLVAYLGTDDGGQIEQRIEAGDDRARLVYDAMIYQIAKEIGAMAAALSGEVDAVVLTGGLTHCPYLLGSLKNRIKYLAQILVFPGEDEMKALALGALRVLTGQEESQDYEKMTLARGGGI
jgi:butyrate kinase